MLKDWFTRTHGISAYTYSRKTLSLHFFQIWEHRANNSQNNVNTSVRIPFGACLKASEVRSVCAREGIAFQAYASLGAGALGLPEHPTVTKIAKELGATTGQVLLRWSLQVCFLTHTSNFKYWLETLPKIPRKKYVWLKVIEYHSLALAPLWI